MNTDTINIFIQIIKSGLNIPVNSFSVSKDDLKAIELLSFKQDVFPIICAGLRSVGLSEMISDSLKNRDAKAFYDYAQRVSALSQIQKALNNSSIDFIQLKGSELCNLYPQQYYRTCSDIDVLVHESDLKEAIRVIECNTDFKFLYRKHHDASLINKHVHLELHFSLLTYIEQINKVLRNVWKYAIRIDSSSRFRLSIEFQIFYITAHIVKHIFESGIVSVRQMLDIWFLKTKNDYDEELVINLCREAGILDFYFTCSKLLRVWFNDEEHDGSSMSLQNLIFVEGIITSDFDSVIRRRRTIGKNLVISRILLSKDDLKAMYPCCYNCPVLIPIFQIVRWFSFLNPQKRHKVKRYIEQSKYINDDVEKYDSLLKNIGL